MGVVAALSSPAQLEALWEEYRLLVIAARDNPELFVDREHAEKMARSHQKFAHAMCVYDAATGAIGRDNVISFPSRTTD
ncbi:MAG TPA: hypothetical protein VF503_00090 [Sphingobium sp.]|uniref:hypothetical protein n=1 Tax=Sphingobium sp. TaxID=1912891 RepID=UPI002ED3D533